MSKSVCLLGCPEFSPENTDDQLFIEALKSQGAEVTVANWQDFLPEASTVHLPRTTWDYTQDPEAFLHKMRSTPNLLNPFALIEWNHDKCYLFELQKLGVPIVSSYFPGLTEESVEEWYIDNPSEEYLIKPRVGASGKKILRIEPDDLLELPLEDFVFVQPMMEEIFTCGEISQMYCRNQLTHAVRKTPKEGEFRIQEEWGGSTQVYQPSKTETDFAESLLDKLSDEPFYARVDYVLQDEAPLLMELELIEPSLYFRYVPETAVRYAKALLE